MEKSLDGKCVDSKLSPISCRFIPRDPCSFRDAPHTCFHTNDLYNSPQVPLLALPRNYSRLFRAWKTLRLESVFTGNCHPDHVALFPLILKFVEMRHNHVLVLRIFKILKWCHFRPFLRSPRVFVAREKVLSWKVRLSPILTHIL